MSTKTEYDIVLLPGDGIGQEVAVQARSLLEAVGPKIGRSFRLEQIPCGGRYYLDHGSRDWPEGAEERCKAADAILLGAVGWPSPSGGPVMMKNGHMAGHSPVIGNRIRLGLYANIRPVKMLEGTRHKISGEQKTVWEPRNVDMVFLRENTEGMYSGMGGIHSTGTTEMLATDIRLITRAASEKIIRAAFELCQKRNKGAPRDGEPRVTCIVKNNVLDGCRLFARIFHEIAEHYPGIKTELAIVDAFTQWLVTEPERYDVCVTTNMFGDIVTDLASVLQGGMGMSVGANLGDDHAMFEPIHGSAPPLAGTGRANPIAMLLAAGEMLAWLGQRHDDTALTKAADAIDAAVAAIVAAGEPLTEDLVGKDKAAMMAQVSAAVREGTIAAL